MIAKLKGLVDGLGDDWVIVDVNGVGYLVFCSGRTLGRLALGEACALQIETHVREDHIHLYGFYDEAERDWFRLLTTVQGVGAKVGLGMLSVLSGDELVHAIAAGDKAAITRAPGVGPKLATRILSELKDKVNALALGGAAASVSASAGVTETAGQGFGVVRDAASALVNLGYNPTDALSVVTQAASTLGDKVSVESLIREGLSKLGPADLG